MNEVFLIGKVVGKIDFKFIINSKNKAIAIFRIKTIDNQEITINAYDKLADIAYIKLHEEKEILVYGILHKKYVEAKNISIVFS